MKRDAGGQKAAVRCAIYTRKSTDEGLDREFNSLDAQREACASYIASQKHEGWSCLADLYDDGGYSGGTADRPALKRLLADIELGKVDCVVVYKVDRLSRSLLDFARIVEIFERQGVAFVSITQPIHTGTSSGRLMLNVLLSFAQFEREIISERTRDKMRAARRKGKRLGGTPVLGYTVDLETRRLIVDPDEANRVRAIFELYLERGGLVSTVEELVRRRWTTKCWTTRKRRECGGMPFNKARLHRLLTNPTYTGHVRFDGEDIPGEHAAIVDQNLFDRVQQTLAAQRCVRRLKDSCKHTGLLAGRLFCAACGVAMIHTYTSKQSRRYRYYVCTNAQKSGVESCPTGSIPALEVERYVVEELAGERLWEEKWDELATNEQASQLARIVDRIEYHGGTGRLKMNISERVDAICAGKAICREVRFGRSAQRIQSEPQAVKPQGPARVAQVMALAIHLQQLVSGADSKRLSGLARAAGLSRSRLSQIASLNLLAPDIQEAILNSSNQAEHRRITERDLRPLVRQPIWASQRTLWKDLRDRLMATPSDRPRQVVRE